MNAGYRIELALNEVKRDLHAEGNAAVNVVADTIAMWYYTTDLTWTDAVGLLVEFISKGTLTLCGKFTRKW